MWLQETESCVLQLRKPAIKCKKEHKKDHSVMLAHRQATKVKKPCQAAQKDVLKNKNCSNVNIQPQKPSYSDEQLRKLVTKCKKHHKQGFC